ncbi:MAG: hypothetical protein R2911_35980 [Caldilineaceae bacterium]
MVGKNPILIGSIIHLQNQFGDPQNWFNDADGAKHGGYLETRGWVIDKPVITHWHDEHIQSFVFTHNDKDRAHGSGSWQIVSATGKATGEPLVNEDKIHLLNVYPGAGYLDSFEWVTRLEPFKEFTNMTIGVFTASVPKRGGGPSGTWTVRLAGSSQPSTNGEPRQIYAGDTVKIENDYPGAGNLHTWGNVKVNGLFEEYEGERLFVFTADASPTGVDKKGSDIWAITLNSPAENLYRLYIRQGDESAPWHDGGVIKIEKGTALTDGKKDSSEPIMLPASSFPQQLKIDQLSDALGAAKEIGLQIELVESGKNYQSLQGKIAYGGEETVHFKAHRPTKDDGRLLRDYLYPDLLKGRTIKLEGLMDTTYRLLCDSFDSMSVISLNEMRKHIKQNAESAGNVQTDLENILTNAQPTSDEFQEKRKKLNEQDHFFQIKQLLNLYELSRILNDFFWRELQDDMKRSLEEHQRNQTFAPLHLLRSCSQSVATDHAIIQQAATQRRWHKSIKGANPAMGLQARELLLMDKLVIKAIAPFKHLLPGDSENIAVVTYLSDHTHIHDLPYTDQFILVGISYDRVPPAAGFVDDEVAAGSDFYAYELLAIPHEVGHHIYQHGALPGDGKSFIELSKQFEANNPYHHWCEELFADLYGCIIAGPLSALGLQALLMSIDRTRAWKDDEVHPTPALRFFILTEILRILPSIYDQIKKESAQKPEAKDLMPHWAVVKNFDEIAAKLDKRWVTMIEQWGYKRRCR